MTTKKSLELTITQVPSLIVRTNQLFYLNRFFTFGFLYPHKLLWLALQNPALLFRQFPPAHIQEIIVF